MLKSKSLKNKDSVKDNKMFFKFVLIFIVSITFVASNDTNIKEEFFVVSTTPSPSAESLLTKMENQLKDCDTKRQKADQNLVILIEIQKSLKNSEKNNLEKTNLEKIETLMTNYSSLQDRVTKMENRIKDIQKSLRNIELHLESPNLQNNETKTLPRHCKDIMGSTNSSGIYLIKPEFSPEAVKVFCDMETHGGGWTYFLNRMDGSVDFYQNWQNYKNGFGSLSGEFWLGLENLYRMTDRTSNELLVKLEDWEGKEVYAHYNSFGIGSEGDGYFLKILGDYNGTAGDSLSIDLGNKFSTKDRDQDVHESIDCANYLHGAFWFRSCGYTNLCGKYLKETVDASNSEKIMYWFGFGGISHSLKKARMMIRTV